jgi:hypothetical protein
VAYQVVPMPLLGQKSAVAAGADKVRFASVFLASVFLASVFARMRAFRRYSLAMMRREHIELVGPTPPGVRGRPFAARALLPRDRIDRRESESVLTGNGVESLLCEDVLPGCMDVAKTSLQRRRIHHDARTAQCVTAAYDVSAGCMDPSATLEAVGEISLAVEHPLGRAAPLLCGLNFQQRACGTQLRAEPAEFMLEDRRILEVGGGEKLAAAGAGHGGEVGDCAGRDSNGDSAMQRWNERRGNTLERARHARRSMQQVEDPRFGDVYVVQDHVVTAAACQP